MNYTFNKETYVYEIENYDEAVKQCQAFIESNTSPLLTIIDDETYKKTWSARTIINSKLKEISDFRKKANNIVLGDFNKKSKDIEKLLQAESNRLTELMLIYKPSEPVYVFKEIKTTDKDAYDKLVAYAKQLGLLEEEQK